MSEIGRKLSQLTFNAADRRDIYENFRQFMLDGATAKKAYQCMIDGYTRRGKKPNDATAVILRECAETLNSGKSLAHSLKDWFPESERSVIAACDIAGRSADGFKEAAKIASAEFRLVKAIRSTSMISLFMMFNAFAILYIVCSFLVPIVMQYVPLERWNAIQTTIYYFYSFLSSYGIIVIAIMIFGVYLFFRSLTRWTGNLRFHFDKFGGYSLYRSMQGAIFLTNVDAMLSSGMSLKTVLLKLKETSDSAWLKERIDGALGGLSNGETNLGTALDSSGYDFPSEKAIIKLQNLFETSSSDGALGTFSERWLNETVEDIEKKGQRIQVICMFLSGFSVVGTTLSMVPLVQQMFNS
ncbi:TPA: hypothetical protein F6U33_25465 [Citrobacter freundii]|jgi:type II secretory pathway component PulF|uniref:Type IV pilus biogenesis protein PilC n=1 Tax=Klebsiella pneumoniae TaxID=573 RepID=A0A223DQC5_KLEPN|nr:MULTISPECIES: type II secretion system F family protein [Enterobacteriaceae]ASS84913.1 Type IV pilus biogenesis protein PilC [Klebsiella pneumoniae]MBA7999409.1 type II secretion system F family protein [Citrobacter freundii]MBJ9068014.1 type II secretion system F family protein [Citrobacter freundii]MCR3682705.1 type II secretion system F family protein [Citrobacter freundii]NSL36671.1 type II secretion system F family protein [Citrobacter werkmanii]